MIALAVASCLTARPNCCKDKNNRQCEVAPPEPCASGLKTSFTYKDCSDWCEINCDSSDLPINAFGVCQCSDVLGFEKKTLGMCTVPQQSVSQVCQQQMPAFTTFNLDQKSNFTTIWKTVGKHVSNCSEYFNSKQKEGNLFACALRGTCTCPGDMPGEYIDACKNVGGVPRTISFEAKADLADQPSGDLFFQLCNAAWNCFPSACTTEDVLALLAQEPQESLPAIAPLPILPKAFQNVTISGLELSCSSGSHPHVGPAPPPPAPTPSSSGDKQKVTNAEAHIVTALVGSICAAVALLVVIADMRKRRASSDERRASSDDDDCLSKALLHSSSSASSSSSSASLSRSVSGSSGTSASSLSSPGRMTSSDGNGHGNGNGHGSGRVSPAEDDAVRFSSVNSASSAASSLLTDATM